MRVLTTLLLLTLSSSSLAAQAANGLAARIDSIVAAEIAAGAAPGLSVAVVRGADTLVLKGYGLADVENGVAVTDRSVFRIGSLTKQFTAAAVLKLVEEGRIRLDAPLSEYLPEYPGPGGRVTIRQLLNHTSGIPSYTSLGDRFWPRARLDLTHEEMLEAFARDSLEFEPGTRFVYNNSAYYLLGMLVERAGGESYGAYLKRTQFEPLGLTQMMYCDPRPIVRYRAEGYTRESGELRNAAPLSMNVPGAAGALCGTARDLVRWTEALVSGRVVSEGSYAQMVEPTRLAGGQVQPYGFGLGRARLGEHDAIQHSGGIFGFSSFMAYYPASDLTIVVLANSDATNTGVIHQKIARAVLGIAEPQRAQEVPIAAAELPKYTGTFDLAPTVPMQIRVFVEGDRLMAQATGQGAFPLRHIGNDTFLGPDATTIRMVFVVEAGRATSFTLHQGGGAIVARRID